MVRATDGAYLLVYGDPGKIAHMLVGTGEGVEQGGLAAVLVACQCKNHRDSSFRVIFAASSRRMVSSYPRT